MTEPRPRALTLIIVYKMVRSGFALAAAITVLILKALGVTSHLGTVLHEVHENAVSQVSLEVSAAVLSVLEPRHLWVVVGGLFLDAAIVFVEGWALLRKWAWGAWLVVGASSVALPFEVVAIVRHLSVLRIVVFVLNLAIVAYLTVRALRERRERLTSSERLTAELRVPAPR